MKGRISKDEWYPVYNFYTESEDALAGLYKDKYTFELTEAEYKDLKRTFKKFEQWQSKLEAMHGEGEHAWPTKRP